MFNRAERNGKTLSLLIVWTMVLGGLLAVVSFVPPAAQAGTCDQVGGVITGDWTITTAQVCTGVVYTVDGTININSGGSLTLVSGGLRFAKDGAPLHVGYSLNVNAGGALVLDNSFVTTVTNAIDPYLFLNFNVVSGVGASANLLMKNGAYLKFPGWFNATGSGANRAILNMTDSTITGFTNDDLAGVFNVSATADFDRNNDAPAIVWSDTNAFLFRSRIERLYELSGGSAKSVALLAGTNLYTYDTYIGIDYSDLGALHNTLTVDGTSNAYLYNVTIDQSQNPLALVNYQTAFGAAAGGNVYLLRWLHATITDAVGTRVSGATIWSQLSPASWPNTATYPDNSGSTTPTSTTQWYVRQQTGVTTWNATGSNGVALIPLWTDRIDSTTLPNAESFGNYQETAKYSTYTTSGSAFFLAYPNVTVADNNVYLTLSFSPAFGCSSGVTTWSFTKDFSGMVSVGTSLVISGVVTIRDGGLYVDQQQNACANVQISGSLSLINATVWSNYPLVVDVLNNGVLTVTKGSRLLLTQRGSSGLLRAEASTTSRVTISDSTIDGDTDLNSGRATLVRDTFLGPSLSIKTRDLTVPSKLWDATITGVSSLALLTDDSDINTVDLDIRNTTFDPVQTSQLVFGGSQNVQLTSVQTYDPDGTWWIAMITGSAKVSRYWWMTIRAVDGTGTLLANANVALTLFRIDATTLARTAVGNPVADDVYYTSDLTWPISAPTGRILYRAFAETRTSSASGRVVDNSYIANGTASIDGTPYYSDAEAAGDLTGDATFSLRFSSLTPDLSVEQLRVSGGNGPDSLIQPINTPLTLTAVIRNNGQIDVRNVTVMFFADNVDKNLDGIMDFTVADFESSAGIPGGRVVNITVPKLGTANASVVWTTNGAVESGQPVSVVVDPPVVGVNDGGAIRETDEYNNILPRTLTLFVWPDLYVSPADISPVDAVVDNLVPLRITVHNGGTAKAFSATLKVFDDGVVLPSTATFDLNAASAATLTINWRPTTIGNHNVMVVVEAGNTTIRNFDYILSNNVALIIQNVKTQPNLVLVQAEFGSAGQVPQGIGFSVVVPIHNDGQTAAQNVDIAVYLDPALPTSRGSELGRRSNLTVAAGRVYNATVVLRGINVAGTHTLMAVADPDNNLTEGGIAEESDNFANFTVTITPPLGTVTIQDPKNGTKYQPGDSIYVSGYVLDKNKVGIAGVTVTVQMRNDQGPVGAGISGTTDDAGLFALQFQVPSVENGAYTLDVGVQGGQISPASASIRVEKIEPFLNQKVPLIGIQWWLFLIILAAVAAIVIGVTLYWKFYGLGKMVECGECGAFIPEDATTCPKCGVEFEKDMAKCSNCQAWIPVDVKRCPECGVEFATGEVEMADYQEKMRLQYDEVVQKFKEESSRQLGRVLSDREFQEWWRKQPSFLTFEDWLREEEEMRKMGSKPCPVCGTLNSVTATVCHKCGSLMKEPPRPPSGGGGPAPVVRPRAAAPGAPPTAPAEPSAGAQAAGAGAPSGPEAIPRRVIRKPIATQPVVQKKVIKRPLAEGQQGESTEGQSTSENPEDEL